MFYSYFEDTYTTLNEQLKSLYCLQVVVYLRPPALQLFTITTIGNWQYLLIYKFITLFFSLSADHLKRYGVINGTTSATGFLIFPQHITIIVAYS